MVETLVTASPREAHVGAKRGTTLKWIVALAAVAPGLTLLSDSSEIPMSVHALAWGAWMLTLWPAWTYLRMPVGGRPSVPFFPLVAVTFGLYFALQVALGEDNQFYRMVLGATPRLDPVSDYADPIALFISGWILLMAGHAFAKRAWPARHRVFEAEYGVRVDAGFALSLAGLALYALISLGLVPASLLGLASFLSNLGLAGIAILVVMHARGQLNRTQQYSMFGVIAAAVIIRLATGFVANVAFLLIAVFASRWIALRRLSWKTLLLVAVCVAAWIASKGVMNDFRQRVWRGTEGQTLTGRIDVLSRLTEAAFRSKGVTGAVMAGAETIVPRSANIDIFADVIRQTPGVVPFWRGDSYVALIGTIVPRFLWPDKPKMELGQAFGHRYHYLGARDYHTSVNCPYVIEFYANFGASGVILGMLLVGLIFGLLEGLVNVPGQPTIHSIAGLVLMLPLFNIESDFGLNFGGLFLNAIAFSLVLFALRRLPATSEGRGKPSTELAVAPLA
jgi:hypothetical protein